MIMSPLAGFCLANPQRRGGSWFAPQAGWSADKARILTGSVGAQEAEIEVEISDLAELNEAWSRLPQANGQEQ